MVVAYLLYRCYVACDANVKSAYTRVSIYALFVSVKYIYDAVVQNVKLLLHSGEFFESI